MKTMKTSQFSYQSNWKSFIGLLLLFSLGLAWRESYISIHNFFFKAPQKTASNTPIEINAELLKQQFAKIQDLHKNKKYDEAIALTETLFEPHPLYTQLQIQYALCLFEQKKYDEALYYVNRVLKTNNNYAFGYLLAGKIFAMQNQHQKAISMFNATVKLKPTFFEAHLGLATSFYNLKRYQEALNEIQIALKINPREINAILNMGHIQSMLGNIDQAINYYQEAVKIRPDLATTHYNLGHTYKHLHDFEHALPELKKAIELQHDHQNAHIALAYSYWALGDLPKAFEEYEWRWKQFGFDHQKFKEEMWDGITSLKEKSITIFAEQGFGDTIQFIRYAKIIKEMGATVICKVQKPLITLLSHCPYIDKLISMDDKTTKTDFKAALLSLPRILNTTLQTIPHEIPYLKVPTSLNNIWKQQLARDPNLKIGICWHVEPQHDAGKLPQSQRTIPLTTFAPLLSMPNVSFYSLQKFVGLDQIKDLPPSCKIQIFDKDFDESHGRFMDTIALINNLDLVITVDTAVAHIAGALGKPVWIILPSAPDGRWMIDRTDTPWYPTMRLFRKPHRGNWENVITQIKNVLTSYMNRKKL